MKPLLRTIFIWILSLSLTGMPVVAMSQDVADLARSGEDTVTDASSEHANDMPCYYKSVRVDTKVTQTLPQVTELQKAETNVSMDDDDCCGDTDCQCQYDMAGQTDGQSNILAILQYARFISFPLNLNSQLILESAVLYHYRDADLDIIPPIV